MMMNFSAIFLDSAGLFLMVMMRRFLSVAVVSFLLLYVALFSLSSHNVHLHGGLVLEHLHGDLLGHGARVLGGGKGGGGGELLVVGGEGGGDGKLLVVGGEGGSGGELLGVGGEGGGGGKLLVNFVLDTSFTFLDLITLQSA
jgi:hypothetical protein